MNTHSVVVLFMFAFHSLTLARHNDDSNAIGFGALEEQWRIEIEQVSWRPRAFLLKGLLTDEECEALINLSKPTMAESQVIDSITGEHKLNEARTSTGTFFPMGHNPLIHSIEERIARVTMLPIENQEAIQILRYVDGQKYEPHWDYFVDDLHGKSTNGGQRVVTVLIYLTNVEEGGETVFPNAEHQVSGPGWSDCARKGLAIHPHRGDALMFYSLFPNGTKDESSLHGSCPTTKGVKWSATKWIHVLPQQDPIESVMANINNCEDVYEECAIVAKNGRCDEDADTRLKFCKTSCNTCTT